MNGLAIVLMAGLLASSCSELHSKKHPINKAKKTHHHEIYLQRHCDKDRYQNYDCNSQGHIRAKTLVWYYWEKLVGAHPSALIAPKSGGLCQNSLRPFQTLADIAAYYKMSVDQPFCASDNWNMAHYILTLPPGKPIIVAYEHTNLPILAHLLGVDPQPDPWPSDRFDMVFHIWTNYTGGPEARLEVVQFGMGLPGDSVVLPLAYQRYGPPDQAKSTAFCVMPGPISRMLELTLAFNLFLVFLTVMFCCCAHHGSVRRLAISLLNDHRDDGMMALPDREDLQFN